MELPQCPLDFGSQLTRTPPRTGGAQGLEWSAEEDLSLLPPSDDVRPIDFSDIGFLRAFIDDLRTDRELVESESLASSENNHGPAFELDYSSDTSTSAYSTVDSASSTSSKARKSKLVRRVLQVFRRP